MIKSTRATSPVTWVAIGLCIGVGVALVAWRARARALPAPLHDYSDRSGLPGSPDSMRGAARADFEAPSDMQLPSALKPYTLH